MAKTLKDEKILVTGCGGFVGGKMLAEMLKRGYSNIRATDIRQPKGLPEGIDFVESNVTKKATLERAVDGCYAIIHIADLFDFFAPWERLYAVNVEGTRNICEAAIEKKVKRMVRFSSGSIYKVGENCREDSPLNPIDDYARSKMQGEEAASEYNGEKGFQIALLRPAVIFGKGSRYGAARIFMTQALMEKLFSLKLLPGEGKFKGPYVHVDDVVDAALHIYENEACFASSKTPSDMAYNINANDAVSPLDIAEMADMNVKKIALARLISACLPAERRELHVTRPIMEPVAKLCSYAVKSIIRAGILKKKPGAMLEPGEVEFMFIPGHLTMDNGKITKSGYEPKHTCRGSMPEVIKYYDRIGWAKLLF